jgi:hypothetical protein
MQRLAGSPPNPLNSGSFAIRLWRDNLRSFSDRYHVTAQYYALQSTSSMAPVAAGSPVQARNATPCASRTASREGLVRVGPLTRDLSRIGELPQPAARGDRRPTKTIDGWLPSQPAYRPLGASGECRPCRRGSLRRRPFAGCSAQARGGHVFSPECPKSQPSLIEPVPIAAR